MQVTFSVDLDAIGILLLFGTVSSLTAAFGSGALIGRFGVGRVLLVGASLAFFGLMGYAVAPSWILLLVVTSIFYLGRGTLDAGLNNFVSANYGAAEMNWLHASWGAGLTVAPMIITAIVVRWGFSWRVGYILLSLMMLGLAAVFLLTLRHWTINADSDAVDQDTVSPPSTASQLESLREPLVLWSIAIFFLYGGVEIGTGQLANTLFVEGTWDRAGDLKLLGKPVLGQLYGWADAGRRDCPAHERRHDCAQ